MVTLYHGTDQRIIEMAPEKRESLKKLSWAIINLLRCYFPQNPFRTSYLKKFYSRNLWGKDLSDEEVDAIDLNLSDALMRIDAQKKDNQNFQYGSLYLTSNRQKAANYAGRSFAFGELGLTAFRLIESALCLGIEEPGSLPIEKYAAPLLEFALGERQPVIYTMDCDESLLKMEDGSDLIYLNGKLLYDCFRYDGIVDFSDVDVEYTPLEDWRVSE